jgi:cytochrome c biogenesis protein CcmG, thiol:disulfide interchange protein DsbE
MQSFPMPSCPANAAIGSSKTDDLTSSISFIENLPVRRSVSVTAIFRQPFRLMLRFKRFSALHRTAGWNRDPVVDGSSGATLESVLLVSLALKRHRVLIAGCLSSFAGAGLVMLMGAYLERWANGRLLVPPLTVGVTMVLASSIPFLIVLFLAIRERRTHKISRSEMLGLFFALPSLVLPIIFVRGNILLWMGMRHQAAHNIPTPAFQARDLNGNNQRLSDHQGQVVLVNVWATWCRSCLAEMPKLDHLYQEYKNQGLVIFGLSDEDSATQRKGLAEVPVTYPLLTYDGQIPGLYRYVAGYPTTFVIDRRGVLQPAINGDQTLEKLDNTVLTLLTDQP